MNLEIRRDGEAFLVSLSDDRLDTLNSTAVRQALVQCVEQGARRVVLDLGRTTFVDSSGLGALVSVLRRLPGPGCLVLRGVGPAVERALRLARLDRILVLEPTPAGPPA